MQTWCKPVPLDQVNPDKYYFLAKLSGPAGIQGIDVYGEWLNGKRGWTQKPGIGVHFKGSSELVAQVEKMNTPELLERGSKVLLLEVPEDYKTRWKARKWRIHR